MTARGGKPLDGPIALRLHDIVIHSNKRWFDFLGGADIRVDVLAVQGNVLDDDPKSFYTPTTVRFGGIGDESTVPLDEHGLLAFYGWPEHFLDISVLVSRDTIACRRLARPPPRRKRPPPSSRMPPARSSALATGAGAIAVKNAVSVAGTLGGLLYKILRQVSGNTIGVYRGNRWRILIASVPAATRLRVSIGSNTPLWYEVLTAAEEAPTDVGATSS